MKKLMILVLMNICFFVFPATFGAHADLSSSMPADDTVLTSMPTEVELTFSTAIDGEVFKMDVLNKDGVSIANGQPSISMSSNQLTLPIVPSESGLITVPYSVISKDGHPIEGRIAFTLDLREETVAPTVVAKESSSSAHVKPVSPTSIKPMEMKAESDDANQATVLSSIIKSAYLLSLLLLAGALLWNFKGFMIPFTANLQLIHLGLLVLFTWSQARNFTRVFEDVPWQDLFLRTEVGQFWTAALVITTLGLYIINRNRFVDLAWVGAILFIKSLNSHAIATETPFFTVGLNFIHLVFAALWVAGLFYVIILWKKGLAHTYIPVFSKMALISIVVLTISGSINAWILAPQLSALWTTEWGYWLIAKLVVVCGIFVIGALVRHHIKKNGSLQDVRLLYFDASLAITIVIIVGVLTQLSPSLN